MMNGNGKIIQGNCRGGMGIVGKIREVKGRKEREGEGREMKGRMSSIRLSKQL